MHTPRLMNQWAIMLEIFIILIYLILLIFVLHTSVALRFEQSRARVRRDEQASGSNGFSKHVSKAYNHRP